MRRVLTDFAIGFGLILVIRLVFAGFEGTLLAATAFGVFFAAFALLYRQWEKRQQVR